MFGFIHRFPYSSFHELNLDWIISEVKKVVAQTDEAVKYMKDNIYDTTKSIIEQAIIDGSITVAVTYDPITEELDIIVS